MNRLSYAQTSIAQPAVGTSGIRVYPNPVTDQVTIDTSSSMQSACLSLYNAIGQVLIRQQLVPGITQINLSHYGRGIYYVKVLSGQTTHLVKMIKNHD